MFIFSEEKEMVANQKYKSKCNWIIILIIKNIKHNKFISNIINHISIFK